jgi:hypothetical protein
MLLVPAMLCPACGKKVKADAWICPACDHILDTSFLEESGGVGLAPQREERTRLVAWPTPSPEEPMPDAMILGDVSVAEDEFAVVHGAGAQGDGRTSTFLYYTAGSSTRVIHPDAIPSFLATARPLVCTPYEDFILSCVDGRRTVRDIQRLSGLAPQEVVVTLLTLMDKGAVQIETANGAPGASTLPERARPADDEGSESALPAVTPQDFDEDEQDQAHTQALLLPSLTSHRPAAAPLQSSIPSRPADRRARSIPFADTIAVDQLPPHLRTPSEAAVDVGRPPVMPQPLDEDDAEEVTAALQIPDSIAVRPSAPPRGMPSWVGRALGAEAFDPDPEPEPVRAPRPSEGDTLMGDDDDALEEALESDVEDATDGHPAEKDEEPSREDDDAAPEASTDLEDQDEDEGPSEDVSFDQAGTGDLALPRAEPEAPLRPPSLPSAVAPDPLPPVHPKPLTPAPELDPSFLLEVPGSVVMPLPRLSPAEPLAPARPRLTLEEVPARLPPLTVPGPTTSPVRGEDTPRRAPAPSAPEPRPEPVRPPAPTRSPAPAPARPAPAPASPPQPRAAPEPRSPEPAPRTVPSTEPVDSGRMIKAQKLFDQALKDKAEGNLVSARMNMKLALTFDPSNARFAAAFDDLSRNPEAQPKNAGAARNRARDLYDQATAAENHGDVDRALELLEKALEEAKQPAFYNRMGVILAMKKREYARAQALVERAIELAPGNVTYERNLAKIVSLAAAAEVKPKDAGPKRGGLFGLLGRKK